MRKRIIPCLFLKNGAIVRSEKFSIHQIIGNPLTELERYSEWAVDEIIYIDISKSTRYEDKRSEHKVKLPKNKFDLLKEISKKCFVPLGFGGGIRSIQDIERTLSCGADKVILNSILFKEPDFLRQAVRIFGSQALVACVDYMGDTVFHGHGRIDSGYKLPQWCELLQNQGIGEIVVQCIGRDGAGEGLDCGTIQEIVNRVGVPVIALGGAGDYYDFLECFQVANPAAVAAGNIFHFREHSDYHIKKILSVAGVDIRVTWESQESI